MKKISTNILRFVSCMICILLSSEGGAQTTIVKDTLAPANFQKIYAGGGYLNQSASNGNQVDGRTHVGFQSTQSGCLHELALNFNAFSQSTQQPNNNPSRSSLFDLNIALYHSLSEAEENPVRVDAFFSESSQPPDIFDNPVGNTVAGNGVLVANIYQAVYDLRSQRLSIVPNQVNYLGLSTTGVPLGISFGLQRSDYTGIVIGSASDYLSGSIFVGLPAMSDFFSDSIQNSVQITIGCCDCVCDFETGDVNRDGIINLLDVSPFIEVLGSGDLQCEADCNQDGVVNLIDVGPFVDLLSGG